MQNDEQVSIENAFNMLVGVTRQVKMTWEEHKILEQSVNVVMAELNKIDELKKKSNPPNDESGK